MVPRDITLLLRGASDGDPVAVNGLLPLVYDELRALAQHYLERERSDHTLQATALVHEAYLKLVDQHNARWQDRRHFFAVAAQAIRRILVDHARTKGRHKRGGGLAQRPLHDAAAEIASESRIDLVALDEALIALAKLNERQARIVELRFFGGLSIDEIGEVLGVSARTVDGDWSMARAWLHRFLTRQESAESEPG